MPTSGHSANFANGCFFIFFSFSSRRSADFQENYYHMKCSRSFNVSELGQYVNNSALLPQLLNESDLLRHLQHTGCQRENSLLFLLLMLGTVWLAVSLYNFNKTPYLQVSASMHNEEDDADDDEY